MAKRRWSTGRRLAYGLGTGLSSALSDITRNRMAERSAERVARRQEEGDIRTAGFARSAAEQLARLTDQRTMAADLPKVGSGEMSVDAYMAKLSALGMDGMFPSEFDVDYAGTGEPQQEAVANAGATRQALQALRPPLRRKLESTVGQSIGAATSPEQLLPDDIMGQLLAADDRVVPDDSEPGMRIGGIRPEAYEYQVRAEDRQRALLQKPTNVVSGVDPTTGQGFTKKLSDEAMAMGVPTSPLPSQTGTFKGQESVAQQQAELDPAFQELKTRIVARMSNLSAALTRQAGVDTKVAEATGVAQAQADVKYDPKNTTREIALYQAMNPTVDKTTDSERRAAANWTPLVNAHVNALKQEAEGGLLTPFAVEATSTPFYQMVFGGQVDPKTQAYVQSARDFVSTLGYIKSGVAVRPDEVNTFLFTMFGFEGESPEQLKQKVQSREIMLGAMQAMVGRSAPEAARVLAAAINNGQIPMTLLTSLEISPAISKALLPLLKNMPRLGPDGKPLLGGQQ